MGIHTPYLHMCHSHIISLSLSLFTRSSVVSVHISAPHSFVTSTTCTCMAQVSLKQARHTTLNISHGSEHGCGDSWERIPERIDEPIIDLSLQTEMSLVAVLASFAASKNRWAQVTTDRKVSVKTLAEESMVLASVTRVPQLQTGGAEGQTYSLLRQSSSIGSKT